MVLAGYSTFPFLCFRGAETWQAFISFFFFILPDSRCICVLLNYNTYTVLSLSFSFSLFHSVSLYVCFFRSMSLRISLFISRGKWAPVEILARAVALASPRNVPLNATLAVAFGTYLHFSPCARQLSGRSN